ncbi:carboxymuconolactone decarboxylase family protein [Krasilnikoviella flava]|uniref:Carboxymuconolactone decarboxylase family protein n=1 Tax=Krasilnikoviella flava TaxID=526729 RepID=A0A1T5KBM3_9MICO|nr:carboxymuconolactone decarboxylase family protein [Krasilnikoviella flava]SKC61081.1 Carboxymuconolactone decarboxylase family protein [Krasilnikoviella flava]
MSEPTEDTPVLDLLTQLTADSVDASSLDTRTLMLVRLAALVAVDAPTVSYLTNLEAAAASGIDADQVAGVLTAIAPIVGTPRVLSAADGIAESLEIEIAVALADAEDQEEA